MQTIPKLQPWQREVLKTHGFTEDELNLMDEIFELGGGIRLVLGQVP